MLVRNWLADLFPLNSSATPTQKRRLKRIRPAQSRATAESLETRALLSNASVTLQLVEMPGSSDGQIDNGEEFDVELHFADTVNGNAVFSGYADISFDPTHLRAVSITHDADYGAGTTGMIDNTVGLIDEVGGTDGLAPPPSTRVATIRFEAISDDDSVITTAAGSDLNSVISVHAVNNVNGLNRDLRDIASYGSLSINSPQPNDFTISAVEDAKPEGDSGNTPFVFNVTRTGDLSSAATVQFDIQGFVTRNFSDSAATADDIVGGFTTNQLVQFGAGVGTAPVTVLVNGDTAIEGNESFAVTLHSQSEGTISDGFAASTILGDDQPPTVTQITASSTEIAAQLSHPFDLTTLNLYDVEAGTLGPADATLVLDAGGPGETNIPGSLVVDGALARFIPTGGPLAAGTYTLTLRSADDAFRSAAGLTLLDGNNDGTPGDDFVHTFTIAAPPAVAVSLPDFARGPGQAVDVPATGQGLPISVSETNGVQTIELSVQYDPTLLTITGATLGADAPAGSTVDVETADPGFTVLTFTAPAAMPAGSADLISLVASVPVDAKYGTAHVVEITNLLIDGVTSDGGDKAVHSVVLLGDSNGNGGYDGLDAQRVARNVVDLDNGYIVHPLIDPVVIGGVNSEGDLMARMLTGLDAQRIAQRVVDLDPEEIPLHAGAVNFDVNITVPRDLTAAVGGTATVPINISDSTGVEAIDITLDYDQTKLSNPVLSPGTIWDGLATAPTLQPNTTNAGQIILTIFSVEALGAGAGSIVEIEFDVAGDVTIADTTDIDLVRAQVNAEDVNPAPVDGSDALDGLVTFVPPPVFSFDFAPTGTTDFTTSLDVSPNDAIVLDIYARNSTPALLDGYLIDLDEGTSSTAVLDLITGFANQTALTGEDDTDITDSTKDVLFFQSRFDPDITPIPADFRLGTITLAAPAAVGSYDLNFENTTGLNPDRSNVTIPPDVFNNLTINVQNAVTPPDFALGDVVVTQDEGNTGDSPHTAFAFTVTRSGDTSERDEVTWMIAGSGANQADAADFETGLNGGSILFEIGETERDIVVNVIGDLIHEADEGFTVTLNTVPRSGTISTASQTATITNDDAPGLTVTIAADEISEADGAAATTATVTRNTDTTGDLTVTLSSDDTTEATVPATVTIPAGQASFTFNIDAVDDAIVDGTQTATITASLTGYVSGTDTLDVTNDDVATLTVTIAADEISEADGAAATTATVTRNTDTTDALTVTLSSDDTTEATVPATVTIPAGQASFTFDIDAVDDAIVDGTQTATITASAAGYTDGSDTVDVVDNEVPVPDTVVELSMTLRDLDGTPGISVGESFEVDVAFRDVVNDQPLFSGYADILFDNTLFQVDGIAYDSNYGAGQGGTIDNVNGIIDEVGATSGSLGGPGAITGLNIFTLQVTAIGPGMTTITSNAGEDAVSEVTSFDIDNLPDDYRDRTDYGTLDITVLPAPDLDISVDLTEISENGGSTTGTVTRQGNLSQPVTVTLASSDETELAIPESVTINSGESTATFTVNAEDDAVLDGTQTVTLTATASVLGSDTVDVDVTDDETTTVSIAFGGHAFEAGEQDGSFEVSLTTAADFDLMIPVSETGSAVAGTDYTDFGGTITIPAGQTSHTFTIDVIDDRVAEFPDILRLQLDDPGINGVSIDAGSDSAGIFILDNDVAGIQISPAAVIVDEDRSTSTFDVSLTSEPTGTVTLDVSVGDASESSVDLVTLTFDDSDWNIPQTVTVTGEDDGDLDGNVASLITVSVQDQMNAPGLFRFARPAEVEVTTLDNETATGPAELNSVTFYNHDADAERDLSPEGNGQRSLIRHIEVVVDGLIAVPLGEVLDNTAVVQNLDTGDDVRLTVESSNQVNGQTIIVIGFLSGTDCSGSLADGNYEFRLDGTAIGVVADDNGTPSPTAAFDFHRLFGDSDGDRDVDGRDLGNYRRAIFANPVQPSVYASVFDYDDDAVLFRDIDDVMELRARYGETLRP